MMMTIDWTTTTTSSEVMCVLLATKDDTTSPLWSQEESQINTAWHNTTADSDEPPRRSKKIRMLSAVMTTQKIREISCFNRKWIDSFVLVHTVCSRTDGTVQYRAYWIHTPNRIEDIRFWLLTYYILYPGTVLSTTTTTTTIYTYIHILYHSEMKWYTDWLKWNGIKYRIEWNQKKSTQIKSNQLNSAQKQWQ